MVNHGKYLYRFWDRMLFTLQFRVCQRIWTLLLLYDPLREEMMIDWSNELNFTGNSSPFIDESLGGFGYSSTF
jgi:hypothetical protein